MKLVEFDAHDLGMGRYNPDADKIGVRSPGDSRKPRLFLRSLNRLKRMRALSKLENLQRQDLLGTIYAPAEEPAGPGMGGGLGF